VSIYILYYPVDCPTRIATSRRPWFVPITHVTSVCQKVNPQFSSVCRLHAFSDWLTFNREVEVGDVGGEIIACSARVNTQVVLLDVIDRQLRHVRRRPSRHARWRTAWLRDAVLVTVADSQWGVVSEPRDCGAWPGARPALQQRWLVDVDSQFHVWLAHYWPICTERQTHWRWTCNHEVAGLTPDGVAIKWLVLRWITVCKQVNHIDICITNSNVNSAFHPSGVSKSSTSLSSWD